MKILLALLILLLSVSVSHAGLRPGCSVRGIPDRYDFEIRTAVRRYLPASYASQWCFFKAQFWVESGLNPAAVSHRGARGIAQMMPATEKEMIRKLGITGTARQVRSGIRLGVGYAGRMDYVWRGPREWVCRLELVWVSYNAGPGSIIRAQKASGGRRCWQGIGPFLHFVTGKHAKETRGYVVKIWDTWVLLTGKEKSEYDNSA